ncbi:MAG: zinc-binding alcohol dehydrogenase, partial [Spirochaetales bacterium]|nr:zinc-binding alcohol dehydrogenase [Spirochaetales bacterium]
MKAIQFTEPWKAELVEMPFSPIGDTIIDTVCSVISPGTEKAILSGGEGWAPLPYIPGYGSVGTVIEDKTGRFQEGKLVFSYGRHSEIAEAETICLPLPEGIDPVHAVFARMAAVSITAVRVSSIELGDRVAVVGAGIVGNLAAQLAALSGADVTVIDPSGFRRERAEACGISETWPSAADVPDGRLFSTVIDATGLSRVVLESADLVDTQGELIILGSPRGEYVTDVTPFLNKSHLCPSVVTVKGAHEWRYPLLKDPSGLYKHSIEGNLELLLKLI